MALSSASTLTEIRAAYLDNAGYEEIGSVAMARTFVTACRMLLVLLPKRSMADGGEIDQHSAVTLGTPAGHREKDSRRLRLKTQTF